MRSVVDSLITKCLQGRQNPVPGVGIRVRGRRHQKKVVRMEGEAVNSPLGHLEGIAAEGFIIKHDDDVPLL